jgi:hypothetical protein
VSQSATLANLARDFAADLTRTVRAVAGEDCPKFVADTPEMGDSSASSVVLVFQSPADGICLRVNGEPLLTLTVEFRCAWDGHGAYLAVVWSRIAVYGRDDFSTEPLLRYEYVKDLDDRLPAAHLQVHGVHEALTEIMSGAGTGSVRGRRRQRRVAGGQLPALSQLHLPLGGHRFRPCLEDILAVLVEEFGVMPPHGDRAAALSALADGRETWRRTQVGSVVRDAPDEAVRVLRELGYDVSFPAGRDEPTGQPARLRAL